MKTISHFLKMKIAGGIAMVADMTGKSKLCQQIEENVSWLSQFGLDEKKGSRGFYIRNSGMQLKRHWKKK